MLEIQKITSLQAPGLEPYRTLKRTREHIEQRIFVIQGEKTVQVLLKSRFTIISLLVSDEWLKRVETACRARSEMIQVYTGEKPLLQKLIGHTMYQPILAVAKIPMEPSLESVLMNSPRPCLLAAFEGISNAENLGSLVRNCAAFGVQALLIGETSSSPFLRRAVRSSMGGVLKLPIVALPHLAQTLRDLRAVGVHCVAAHPRPDSQTAMDVDLTRDCCLVFGSEGHGISESALAACDECAAIPQTDAVDSLNVANAGAALLYEVWRQRGKFPQPCSLNPGGGMG
jgi:tRNA G18 (ribose-2'-O)-methylase SpoU